jgi:ribosomal protein RSM22 (predicted rRNA methylase)
MDKTLLPLSVQKNIQSLLVASDSTLALKTAREQLTNRYREAGGQTKSGFSSSLEALAYIATRLPATYAAIKAVLSQAPVDDVTSVLDLGAGPGTAALAAALHWPKCSQFHLIEGDSYMKELSQQLLQNVPEISHQQFSFEHSDLLHLSLNRTYDLVILSYVLNELSTHEQATVLQGAWEKALKGVVIVMPGTPIGYEQLMRARDVLIDLGAFIAAPCPHNKVCPLKEGDWCHFSTRLSRSSLHKKIKDAALSYEDEKYSYIIALRDISPRSPGRIIRKPLKRSGHVTLDLCTKDGLQRKIVSRREKVLYKAANERFWGDNWGDI